MSIVTLHLPEVKACETSRPKRCSECGGETFQRWGGKVREVKDPHLRQVMVYRYRCNRCQRTFRHYPEGIDRAQQSQRMRALAAIGWLLGLSYRGLSGLLAVFGVTISRMTGWRDVQARAKALRDGWKGKKVRVIGVDGAYVRAWGKIQPVLVVMDIGSGKPISIGYVDEKDPQAVKRFLEPLVKQLGVSVMVTDDLFSYKQVADRLRLEHQICQFHVRRWVGRTLYELQQNLPAEWLWMVGEVRQILTDLPIEGDKRLMVLYRQLPPSQMGRPGAEYTPLEQLRSVIIRLEENWARFRVFDYQVDVPWTNNPTEQGIGRMKMRARTVRGYKNCPGMLNGLMVAGSGVD
jgi:transposase-like protein